MGGLTRAPQMVSPVGYWSTVREEANLPSMRLTRLCFFWDPTWSHGTILIHAGLSAHSTLVWQSLLLGSCITYVFSITGRHTPSNQKKKKRQDTYPFPAKKVQASSKFVNGNITVKPIHEVVPDIQFNTTWHTLLLFCPCHFTKTSMFTILLKHCCCSSGM